MLDKLTVGLLQIPLVWYDAKANRASIDAYLEAMNPKVKWVVLPEMFNSGFTMEAEKVAETMDGPTVEWLIQKSEEKTIAICGSLVIEENGEYFNRFVLAKEGKLIAHYDKRHLFRMADEHKRFASGKSHGLTSLFGWNAMMRVCYDLRFPVWSRTNETDLQIYVANWPEVRVEAWRKLLMARAIENQCYVIGVNRVGKDGNGIDYNGYSIVIDPKGEPITQDKNESVGWIEAELNLSELQGFREKFPVGLDADSFQIDPTKAAE